MLLELHGGMELRHWLLGLSKLLNSLLCEGVNRALDQRNGVWLIWRLLTNQQTCRIYRILNRVIDTSDVLALDLDYRSFRHR